MPEDILIAAEAAELLRVSKQRLYELSRRKQIPVILLGERQFRYSRKALERWLEAGGSQKSGEENEPIHAH